MKINLKLDVGQKKKQGHPLVLSIYVSKTDRIYKYSGFYSFVEIWDFDKNEPKKTHPHYIGIMDYILKLRLKINQLVNKNQKLTAQQILEFLFGKDDDFYHFWELRIKEMRQVGKNGNATRYEKILNVLRKYKGDLKFSEIDYNFLQKFKLYKYKTCKASGVNLYVKTMRAIYNEGIRRGVYLPQSFTSPFVGVLDKEEATNDKYLSLEEMQNVVQNKELDNKYYDYFMIMFLFGGIDFVDLANLEKKHLKNGRVKFERFKGGTNEVIDNKIFPKAWELLKKYESDSSYIVPINFERYEYERFLFVQNFRKFLNKIGVKSYFSSKSARYTFINIGKELLLNRDVIMELTGHARNDVHSIYEGKFSNNIKDEVHRKIIDAVLG